jgi:hypothetical protein
MVTLNVSDVNLTKQNITAIKILDHDTNITTVVSGSESLSDGNITLSTSVNADANITIVVDINTTAGTVIPYYYNNYGVDPVLESSTFVALNPSNYLLIIGTNTTFNMPIDGSTYAKFDVTVNFGGNSGLLLNDYINYVYNAPVMSAYTQMHPTKLMASPSAQYSTPFLVDSTSHVGLLLSDYPAADIPGDFQYVMSLLSHYPADSDLVMSEYNVSIAATTVTIADNNVTDFFFGSNDANKSYTAVIFDEPTTSTFNFPLITGTIYYASVSYISSEQAVYDATNSKWLDSAVSHGSSIVAIDGLSFPTPPQLAPHTPTLSVNLTDPLFNPNNTQQPLIHRFSTTGSSNTITLSQDERIAYIADDSNGLVVLNLDTNISTNYATPGIAQNVTLSDDETKAYVADYTGGVVVFDITNTPTQIGVYDTVGRAYDIALSNDGTKAYVADDTNGLVVLDITANNPILLETYSTSGFALGITLSQDGTKAYLANSSAGVVVLDITSNMPTHIGTYDSTGHAQNITLSKDETKAYVADNTNGLVILDITSAIPTPLGSLTTLTKSLNVVLSPNEKIAYVADDSNGLVVLDVTTNSPQVLGTFNTPNYALNLALSKDGSKVYIADYTDGVAVIDTTLTLQLPTTFSTEDINISISDADLDTLTVTALSDNASLVYVSPGSQNYIETQYNSSSLGYTLENQDNITGTVLISVDVNDSVHTPIHQQFYVELYTPASVSGTLNINNVTLTDVNITTISLHGVDGNLEEHNYTSLSNGLNELFPTITNLDQNYSIIFEVNNNGSYENYFYNFQDGTLEREDTISTSSSVFKTTISATSTSLSINAELSQFNPAIVPSATPVILLHNYSGTLLNNDLNITHVILFDGTNEYVSVVNASGIFNVELNTTGYFRRDVLLDSTDGITGERWTINEGGTTPIFELLTASNSGRSYALYTSVSSIDLGDTGYDFDSDFKNSYLHVNVQSNDIVLYEGASSSSIIVTVTQQYLKNISITSTQADYTLFSVNSLSPGTSPVSFSPITYMASPYLVPFTDVNGTSTLTLKVTDDEGAYVETMLNVTVKKSFDITLSESSGIAPLTVDIGFTEYDLGTITDQSCSVGQGYPYSPTTYTGETAQHTFTDAGLYQVICYIEADGRILTKSRDVNVLNASHVTSIDLEEGVNLISLPFEMRLENSSINDIFGSDAIDVIYKYSPIGWSYWNNKAGYDKSQPFTKMSTISSKDGLYIVANKDTTLYFDDTHAHYSDVNATREFIFTGWHFVGFNEDKTPDEIHELINHKTNNTNFASYLWITQNRQNKFYTGFSDINALVPGSIPRISGKIKATTPVWIYIDKD